MKIKLITLAYFLVTCMACTDFPDPSNTALESYTFTAYGQDQKGFAGDYLTDSLRVNIHDYYNHTQTQGMQVQFQVTTGGGEVMQPEVTVDNQGNAVTHWKLGTASSEQVMEVRIFNTSGKYLASVPFRAVAFLSNTWNTIKLQPDISINDLAADTVNGITFAIMGGNLYKQGSSYFDWKGDAGFPIASQPGRIVISNDNIFFVGTWFGKLFKSTDHGASWLECAKPWSDYSGYYYLKVTSDNSIWVTTWERPMRCSRDGGLTWTTVGTGLRNTDILGDIYRLTDGTLFFHSASNLYLSKSTDDGLTWTPVNTPSYSTKFYVTETDELILINQENGISIFKSTDQGLNFTLKHSVMPQFGTSMDHIIHKKDKDYYILIPGYGILRTQNFEQFDNFWRNNMVNDMFMDDEGVIIVRELYGQQVHYRDNP